MKGCLVFVLGSILSLGVWGTVDANAQGTSSAAQAHVDAAKAAMNPNNPSPQKWQVFDYLFKMHCTPPKPNAAPAEGGRQ